VPVQPGAPPGLRQLLDELTYKPGWHFTLIPAEFARDVLGWELVISAWVPDIPGPGMRRVRHPFPVPGYEMEPVAWQFWLLGRIDAAEHWETCAWFAVGQGRPFDPRPAAAATEVGRQLGSR
jgi:hypothetical protein